MSAVLLSDHLAAAEAALEQGDTVAAAEAIQLAAGVCAGLQGTHTSLPPADALRLQAQHARLTARAADVRDSLESRLAALGRSRLARNAYGRR